MTFAGALASVVVDDDLCALPREQRSVLTAQPSADTRDNGDAPVKIDIKMGHEAARPRM